MAGKMPPVPPAARSPHGGKTRPDVATDKTADQAPSENIAENTTNKGLQQDR